MKMGKMSLLSFCENISIPHDKGKENKKMNICKIYEKNDYLIWHLSLSLAQSKPKPNSKGMRGMTMNGTRVD